MTNGQATWNITDWRTGDTIAEGAGDYDAYGEAGQRLDPDGKWFHIDRIDHIENPQVDPTGVPTSLAEALQEWLGGLDTPDEDVAAVLGWSVKEAARHREGGRPTPDARWVVAGCRAQAPQDRCGKREESRHNRTVQFQGSALSGLVGNMHLATVLSSLSATRRVR
ncbi:hypothetical protein ACFWDW_25795 [Streptomyces roseolus]|uniref:hypothetical protein n=1 Tax=Streptomyces roseolus TaxID=67358 RepID=UPI003646CAA8